MGEYIKREKLPQKKERGFFLDDDFNAGWNACLNNIKNIPAADVRPVARGKWRKIGKNSFIFVCSACDKTFPHKTSFCPNCGADMREALKEEK